MSTRAAIETATENVANMVVAVDSGFINMSRLVDHQKKVHKNDAAEKLLLRK